MCGLVGMMGDISNRDKEVFNTLLFLDYLRGPHSTGIAVIDSPDPNYIPNTELFKSLGGPWELYKKYEKDFPHGLYNGFATTIIGHNRFATQGKIVEENAHPFQLGDIIGAHNGTVQKWSLKDFKGYKDFEIDSQIILNELNHSSLQDIWDEADGAIALSYYDTIKDTMNLVRNKERSLFYTTAKTGKTLFWASEEWMIHTAAGRARVAIEKPVEVVPNKHYEFFLEKEKVMVDTKDLTPFDGGKYFSMFSYHYPVNKNKTTFNQYINASYPEASLCKMYLTGWSDKTQMFFGETTTGQEVRISLNPKFVEAEKARLNILLNNKKKIILCFPYGKSQHYFSNGAEKYNFKAVDSLFIRVWLSGQMIKTYKEVDELIKESLENEKKVDEEEEVEIYGGMLVDKTSWLEQVKCGCQICTQSILWEDKEDIVWSDTQPVCLDCQKNMTEDSWAKDFLSWECLLSITKKFGTKF